MKQLKNECCICGIACDGSLMRTDKRYTRTRAMLTDEAVPRRLDGGIALCHRCQRSVYFAGGFLKLLLTKLDHTIRETKPKGCCPACGAQKIYFIQRYERLRCRECRKEWSPNKGTARASGKKTKVWYDRVNALHIAGHNPHQISKIMGCYDAKPIYDFLKRQGLSAAMGSALPNGDRG